MAKSSKHREASKAYNNVKKQGGTKEEAKKAKNDVINKWDDHYTGRKPFSYPKSNSSQKEDSSSWDFDSELNGNGTNWHTSEDL